jgi:hypothetical protein
MATGRVTGTDIQEMTTVTGMATGTQGMTTVTGMVTATTITTPGHLTKRCRKST